jgi:hypothetical protein
MVQADHAMYEVKRDRSRASCHSGDQLSDSIGSMALIGSSSSLRFSSGHHGDCLRETIRLLLSLYDLRNAAATERSRERDRVRAISTYCIAQYSQEEPSLRSTFLPCLNALEDLRNESG